MNMPKSMNFTWRLNRGNFSCQIMWFIKTLAWRVPQDKKLKYLLIIALFRSLPTRMLIKGASQKLPWLSSDLNTLEPSQAPGAIYTGATKQFFQVHQGRNCPKRGTHLRLSEPRPTFR